MDPAAGALDTIPSNDGGKVKKARKRPKTSNCIPCTKRRQKCDRSQPCSACISQGKPLLCRWEAIPHGPSPGQSSNNEIDLTDDGVEDDDMNEDGIPAVLRTTKLDLNENREMIRMLSKRIQNLESRVVSSTGPGLVPGPQDNPSSGSSHDRAPQVEDNHGVVPLVGPSPGRSSSEVPSAVGGYELFPATPVSYETSPAATAVSPTSLPPQSPQIHVPSQPKASRRQSEASSRMPSVQHGELYPHIVPFTLAHPGEFVGRGNALSIFHSICSSAAFQLPQAKLSAPTSITQLRATPSVRTIIPVPEVQHLIPFLPGIQHGNLMIDAFFREVNWRYGIPERWFSATCCQMWTSLQSPMTPLSHQLNPYWLCLFFSVLACAPQSLDGSATQSPRPPETYDSDTYYICASTARRIAEDNYFRLSNTPPNPVEPHSSPADGCMLGCLAIPLLCDFLAERGRMSEAWNLMGNGIRAAQSIGLHRDPASSVWQGIPEEEKDLRRNAWWGLYIWDRLLSYILGRPQMVSRDMCDVAKPSIIDGNGRKDCFNLSRVTMIELADLVSEVLDKCINAEYPTWAVLTEMDVKFENWELGLPPEFKPSATPEQDIVLFVSLSQSEIGAYTRHRYMITTWYRFTRLKLYTLGLKRHPLVVSIPVRIENPSPIRTYAERGIRFALDLIKYQCDTFDCIQRSKSGEKWLGDNWYFEGCLSLFEATLALFLALTRIPGTFFTPPGENPIENTSGELRLQYDEMTRVISRVLDVFSEVVVTEKDLATHGEAKEGKRAEIASKALDALQKLLKEHWWKLDPRTDQTTSMQAVDTSGEFRTLASSVQLSPRRTGASPATGTIAMEPGLPYLAAGYGGTTLGSVYPSHQVGSTQAFAGLVTPLTETPPSPSLMQQSQMEGSAYSSAVQNPMTSVPYTPSDVQPLFKSPLLPPGNISYPRYTQGSAPEPILPSNPLSQLASSPYDYQPENRSFSSGTSAYMSPFPFTPASNTSSVLVQNKVRSETYMTSQNQDQSQEYHQQQMPQSSVASPSTEPTPLEPSPVASAYAYDPSSSSAVRPMRSPPGDLPPSQGMKIIHYVAPGSMTTGSTTISGTGIIGNSVGTMSFTVSPPQSTTTTGRSEQPNVTQTPTGPPGDQSRDVSGGGYYR